jgi:DNA-binding transcriptional ArsR family regulator
MVIMKETSVESLFGIKAGIVWQTLNKNGPSNIGELVKATSLSREEVYGALGWLGREDKIVLEQKGRAMLFSLREEETRLAVVEATTAEPASKSRSKSRKTKQPKNTKKTRSVKSPLKQTESPSAQSEKVEEFLLH